MFVLFCHLKIAVSLSGDAKAMRGVVTHFLISRRWFGCSKKDRSFFLDMPNEMAGGEGGADGGAQRRWLGWGDHCRGRAVAMAQDDFTN